MSSWKTEGVLTLLEILSHSRTKEEEKAKALRLLLNVSYAGRKYKEIICENHGKFKDTLAVIGPFYTFSMSIWSMCLFFRFLSGVKAVGECLAKSNTDGTQEAARTLLESVSYGNPKYQSQIFKGLIALTTCTSPKAQRLVLHTLCTVQVKTICHMSSLWHTLTLSSSCSSSGSPSVVSQSKMKTAHDSLVDPVLNMLKSIHLEVQDEGKWRKCPKFWCAWQVFFVL